MKHVLITGFYDWKELGTPPQLDRCRDNPSCRVLTGSGIGSRDLSGPLATQLKAWASARPSLQLHFALLPVTWASHADLELEKFDQVIHLGLGVYDSNHRILIEEGAYNRHRGQDAAGVSRDQRIEEEADSVLIAPPQVQEGLKRALSVSLPAPFTLSSIPAREENSYLCNAVHFRALQHIHSKPEGQLQQAYFVHIPHAENQDDRPLAAALFKLLIALLGS